MARPRKPTRRARTIGVKVTEAEHQQLMAEVSRHGLPSIGAMVRQQVFTGRVEVVQRMELSLTDREALRRVGVNLNQLAKSLHTLEWQSAGLSTIEPEARRALARINAWLLQAGPRDT
jgi:Bacterial mobilisation protein (MobC)